MNLCYQCKKRIVGCHDSCEDYQKMKREKEAINASRRKYYFGCKHISSDAYSQRNRSAKFYGGRVC